MCPYLIHIAAHGQKHNRGSAVGLRLLALMLPMTIMKQRLAFIVTAIYFLWNGSAGAQYREEIPFVPTPIEVVDQMLELAAVAKGDVVYDLGSGDGRIVIRAAKKYGVRAVGIEADPLLIAKAREAAKAEGVSDLVEFRAEDALKADLSPATVITVYMLPWFNEAMKPSFRKYLKPGTRIVAHDFGIEGWEPDATIKLPEPEVKTGGRRHYHTLYLWRIRITDGR
jgi:SAM-dependent methyltransferase